jgi:hypothetical protein
VCVSANSYLPILCNSIPFAPKCPTNKALPFDATREEFAEEEAAEIEETWICRPLVAILPLELN